MLRPTDPNQEKNMNRMKFRRTVFSLLLVVICATATARAADAPERAKSDAKASDTNAKAPAEGAKRGAPEIMKDFQETAKTLQSVLSSPEAVLDEAKRKEAAPKVVPALKKMLGLLDEMKQSTDEQAKIIAAEVQPQLQTFLAVFGDQDTTDQLEKQAKNSDKDQSLSAQGSLLQVRWIKSGHNAQTQQKIVTEAVKMARDNPKNEKITGLLMSMSEMGPATPEMADQLQDAASEMGTQSAQAIKQQVASSKKLRAMENKPLVLEGARNDGSKFSTSQWKGKVVLVDFWATWCGPCRAELPRVKKAYADFHGKGLEVLGVSCDNDGHDLDQFLQENKDMPWPQLFDASKPGWHPLATQFGITGIPTMFLIDKQGVLRSVSARENFEQQIPKMLAEKTSKD
jgi:thiol-disulfide isomerase/thioredoxin